LAAARKVNSARVASVETLDTGTVLEELDEIMHGDKLVIRCPPFAASLSAHGTRSLPDCMYVCMYVFIYLSMYLSVYVRIHTNIHTYIHTHIHTYITCMYVSVYVCMCAFMYAYIYIHTYIHTYIHHIYLCTQRVS
jgi:hypothetical protein